MTGVVYRCGDARRRMLVATTGPAGLTGIDWLEVRVGPPLQLIVYLVKPVALTSGTVTDATVALTGGERIAAPKGSVAAKPTLAACTRLEITFPAGTDVDFSTYTLTLVRGPDYQRPPAFIDPRLASVDFSFKVDCPSDFDCAPDCPPGADAVAGPPLDYTARDYEQLRQLMLDRMAALVPGFGLNQAADFTTTLIEALAYDADQASYRLDWVGTEAFIGTARARSSLRRHARLVDYAIGEGASARTFASLRFDGGVVDGMVLAQGTPLLPYDAMLPAVVDIAAYRRLLSGAPIVFETLADMPLWQWRGEIAIYTWGDDQCLLCAGATAATLVDASGGTGGLAVGDLLLLEETRSPVTGLVADARRERRQIVRLIAVTPTADPLATSVALVDVRWAAEDALGFDLAVQVKDPDGTLADAFITGAVARANIAVAEHGVSLPPVATLGYNAFEAAALRPALDPPVPPDDGAWAPEVRLPGALSLPLARVGGAPGNGAAATLLAVDVGDVLPALALDDDFESWTARADLLASDPFARDVVVETAIDGNPVLRFGDNINGLAPVAGASLGVHGRFGTGIAANLGPDALAHVVLPDAQKAARLAVTNPLPAVGGADPESAASIRSRAPEAFWRQERAITAADYATFARRLPGVADALAIPVWTGAWWTMLVYVDRVGGATIDAAFEGGVAAGLERYRMMGFDVAVTAARPAPLDIAIEVCAMADAVAADVALRVRRALSPSFGGKGAFFDPDRFGFATALQLSQLIAAVMAVPGVSAARVTRFQRWARVAAGELAAGVIQPNGPEILKLADDASRPELGRLTIVMGGGL
ncbi:baseplate J/gp47 family protein [Sphingomonas nostoxanthinifaciens]|uniref:baseplate J/gp47 family protein n=1 Tax=Sphingomonas nostoxanthinifaciens TaxID=2872652 RepID=UPI001CC1D346|nr:baseplate J/gp47 family protein [Sphingomonas nostoxanthinifaciens]UAK23287.1 baseplate J/gp47 family protein [Sphingomonas nostoxanthinifaciens]